MTEKLFAYGTLKDLDIQTALFGRQLNGMVAHVKNWGLYMAQDGYLFVKPSVDGRVDGLILELESEDMEKADAWEDLNVYNREICSAVNQNDEEESVHIYTRRIAKGHAYHGTGLHGRDLSEILRDIKHLQSTKIQPIVRQYGTL